MGLRCLGFRMGRIRSGVGRWGRGLALRVEA